jgi:nitrogen fixation protein NifU and related proteins
MPTINAELRELYQDVILDHNRHPRNRGRIPDATGLAEGHNPLCGDTVTVFVRFNGDYIDSVTFEGQGCAISTASASMMTEAIRGRSREEIEVLFREFQSMVTSTDDPVPHPNLGDLEVFSGVREYPVRIKCATLPWHTLNAALEGGGEVSTE